MGTRKSDVQAFEDLGYRLVGVYRSVIPSLGNHVDGIDLGNNSFNFSNCGRTKDRPRREVTYHDGSCNLTSRLVQDQILK